MKNFRELLCLFVCLFALARVASAQLAEIDPAKLPPGGAAQGIYTRLLPIERYGQSWSNTWNYDVPKKEIVGQFTAALNKLTTASKAAPANQELLLLTGLVAHFAYNVDVESAWDPAVKFLQEAAKNDSADYRANWFLGIHQCQATDNGPGMSKLLAVEASLPWQKLPIDFWNDYVTCSVVTMMPAHGLRAITRAVSLGAPAQSFTRLADIENKRFLPSDGNASYTAKQAWSADKIGGDVIFTSNLCGVAVTAHESWGADIEDVKGGQCAAIFSPPAYKSRLGKSSPSVMLLERGPKAGESLSDFAGTFTSGKYAGATPSNNYCPSVECLSFEIQLKDMYAEEGGAHLEAIAFERDMPAFDGLIYEHPASIQLDTKKKDVVQYFRPDEVYHRLPGKRYFLLLLDSNEDIFKSAKNDFDFFVHSVVVE